MNAALIGLQWGDEGKGKLIDSLMDSFDVVCRYQGGANAGHTVIHDQNKIPLHLIPSGIFHPDKLCIIGNGVVIDINQLMKEIKKLKEMNIDFKDRLFISKRTHLILPSHFTQEKEMKEEIGTTGRGIGPAYADKMRRKGIRMGDIFSLDYLKSFDLPSSFIQTLKIFRENYGHFITDTVILLHNLLKEKKRILFEGAQGALLDIDFGTYPYVTSSNPTPGGILTGTGTPLNSISRIIGVMKAYTTRVGKGPFPTEMDEKTQKAVRDLGKEYGTTTGRPRRCGWLDLVGIKYTTRITGTTEIALTKIDTLDGFPEIKIANKYNIDGEETDQFPSEVWKLEKVNPIYKSVPGWDSTKGIKSYKDLPRETKIFIRYIEDFVGIKVRIISTGRKRGDLICV